MTSRSGIQASLQPDVKDRITTLAAGVEYKTGNIIHPFQVKNQQSADLIVTVINKSGEEIAGVVLNAKEWEPSAIFGIKADATKTSVDLLIGW